jgi:hypothetical protein
VQSYGHEAVPTYVLIHPATGRQVEGLDSMVWSPDSTRIATVAPSWDNCAEGGVARLTIWHLTDTLPVREYEITPWRCEHVAAWAPTDPHWETSDVLAYTRVNFPRAGDTEAMAAESLWTKQPVRLTLRSGKWTAIEP